MKRVDIVVLGRGKVGCTLARAWRARGWKVALRKGTSRTVPPADLLVMAVPDGAIEACAVRVAESAASAGVTAAVHCAGALSAAALRALAGRGIPVAQMHPLVSFARRGARLPEHGAVLVQGDRVAVAQAKRAVRVLGLLPISGPVDPGAYHAAAALVSNGAVALVAAAANLLVAAGLRRCDAGKWLGPLLASTGNNVTSEGLPGALTGPVRRGDAATVARHRDVIAATCPEQLALFRELVVTQLDVARLVPVAERAPRAALEAIATLMAPSGGLTVSVGSGRRTKPAARSRI